MRCADFGIFLCIKDVKYLGPKIRWELRMNIRELNRKRIQKGKKLLMGLTKALFDKPNRSQTPISDVQKILVLRLDAKLGDSVTSTGFLRSLHESYPQAEITVATVGVSAELFSSFDFIKVIEIKKGLGNLLKGYKKLKENDYDVLINTSHILSPRVVFLASKLNAKRKISFGISGMQLFDEAVQFDENLDHISVRYQKALLLIGGKGECQKYSFPLPSDKIKNAVKAVADLQGKKFIVINSFAGARLRNLSKQKTFSIVKLLNNKYPDHLIVSVGNEGDQRILNEWLAEAKNSSWIVLSSCKSIFENAYLVSKAQFVITPDTSLAHFASAFQTPLISIYRQDHGAEKNSKIWAPTSEKLKIIYTKGINDLGEDDINNFDEQAIDWTL